MNPQETPPEETKLPWHAHAISGWPLLLVIIGGALGGLCGGLAYGLSITLLKKKGASGLNYLFAGLIGLLGTICYFAILIGLAIAFPDLFKR